MPNMQCRERRQWASLSGRRPRRLPSTSAYVPGQATLNDVPVADSGTTWRSLGFYVAGNSGKITITLTAGTDGVTVADAVAAIDDWQLTTPAGSFNTLQTKNGGFALRDKYGTIETFNAAGMVTDVLDRLGNHTQFAYNDSSHPQRISTVTEQGGLRTTFNYSNNALNSVVDGYGRKTNYATSGSATTVTLPNPGHGEATPSWTFSYNAAGLLSQIDAPNGNETDLLYDAYHRLATVIDGVGATDTAGDSLESIWELQSGLSDALQEGGSSNASAAAGPANMNDLGATYTTYSQYEENYDDPVGTPSTWTYRTDAYGYVTSLTKPATTNPSTGATVLAAATWTWTRNADGLPTEYDQPAGGGGYGGTLARSPRPTATTPKGIALPRFIRTTAASPGPTAPTAR